MNDLDLEMVFKLLLQNSSTCSILVNLDGNIIRYNEAYKNLVGYSENEIRTKADTLYVTKDAFEREISFIKQLLSGDQSDIQFRSTRLTKSGRILQVEVTAILFKDRNGKPDFVLKRIEDITDKVKSDDLNKSMLTLLKTILEEIPLTIYLKDLESRFIMVSKHFVCRHGCSSANEIIGKTDFDFFQEEHARKAYEDEQFIIRSGQTIKKEEKEVHKDGSLTYSLTTKLPLKGENGNIIGTYGLSQDITAIKLAEKKAKEANKELDKKNRELKETIEELSQTQNRLIFSEKMAALGSLIGGIAHEINTPLGAIKASSTNISEVVEKIEEGLPWLINNATPEEIKWLFTLLNEADARDISVFSREERQKKRELTSFFEEQNIDNAPVIADLIITLRLKHSKESYLTFLKLPNAQQVLQTLKVLFSLKRNANNIFISIDKAAKVVSALRNYIYKNETGESESTDLIETINTVLILTANMIKHSKTDIITNFKPIPLCYCRQDEICQIWTNIITNSIQAMGEGGTLEIGTEYIENDMIKIWFKDNGAGIPDNIKDRIFEPYFTTKKKGIGTGMGLDISRQIIESHNGKIYFKSETGVGTTFFIEIPVSQRMVNHINNNTL